MATISTENFENCVPSARVMRALYGDAAAASAPRFAKLAKRHSETFGSAPDAFFSSPGRIEIVGNHTDHNAGKVLAAAVTVDTLGAVAPRDDGVIEVKSENYPMLRVSLDDLAFRQSELGTSVALIKGVAEYFVRAGKRAGGFTACMDSCVPKGSGVSSSSSFELIIAEILNHYYNDGALDPIFKAKASQYAENVYFGKPSGLMDQSAIALGGVNMIDFRSFDNPVVEKAVWRFDDLEIFVVATGGDHSDLTDDYAALRAEMKTVAEALGGKLLRDIEPGKFYAAEDGLRGKIAPRALLRAEHFFEENVRVERALKAVGDCDEGTFLSVVNESGRSSAEKLQNLYSVHGDHLIEEALAKVAPVDGVLASRVHGGGFAGTILLFVAKDRSDAVNEWLKSEFGKDNVFRLLIREPGACRIALTEEV